MRDARAKLQRVLDEINVGRADELLGRLLRVLLYGAHWVRLHQTSTAVLIQRDGNRLRFTPESHDEPIVDFLPLANLVNAVGVDRVRQCPLQECGRWFIAHKRQLACTPQHAQRVRYERWRGRSLPKKVRRRRK